MCESVLKRADADICEKRETLGITILIRRVLGHLHIAWPLTPPKWVVFLLGFSRTIPQ